MTGRTIFCAVRHSFVARTPEECVRQRVLDYFFRVGGYPGHLARVEMPLDFFAAPNSFPKRRLDIVCFHKKGDSMLPLLLVECKASIPHSSAIGQLLGYNFFVKAPFTALAWSDAIILHHGETLIYQGSFQKFPSYSELVRF